MRINCRMNRLLELTALIAPGQHPMTAGDGWTAMLGKCIGDNDPAYPPQLDHRSVLRPEDRAQGRLRSQPRDPETGDSHRYSL